MSGVVVYPLSKKGATVFVDVEEKDGGDERWQRFFTERKDGERVFIEHKNVAARRVVSSEMLQGVIVRQLERMGIVRKKDFEVDIL